MITINLKERILVPLTFFLTLALAVLVVSLYVAQEKQTNTELTHTTQTLEGYYQRALEDHSRKLIAILDLITNDVALHHALKTTNRAALLAYSNPLFHQFKSKQGITHFYFHTAQRVNLLRVHQPERYGDTIDRITLLEAERSGQTSYGVEIGPLGTFTLRVVAPVRDKENLLGYIEIGEEIYHLIDNIARELDVEFFVSIDKRLLKRDNWEVGMQMLGRSYDWDQYPDSVIALQTSRLAPGIISPLMEQEVNFSARNSDTIEVAWQGRSYRAASIGLVDAGNQVVGNLGLLQDVTERIIGNHSTLVLIGTGTLVLCLLLISFFYVVLNRSEKALITDWQKRPEGEVDVILQIGIKKLFVTLFIAIFTAELVIMLFMPENLSTLETVLIDVGVLVLVLFPVLYEFVVCPFIQQARESIKVERAKQRISHIMDHSANEIFTFDPENLRFVEVSQGGCENLGYTMDELKKLTPVDLKPEFTHEEFEALIQPLRRGEEQKLVFETEHKRKDGSRYPVEVSLQLLGEETRPSFVAIAMDISERKNYISELNHKALYDSLTELPNRFLLHDRLHQALRVARRNSKPVTVIVIDVVRLSDVNDVIGHAGGDLVLLEISKRLRRSLHESDTVARIGGDEFALVLFENVDVTVAKIQKLFEQTVTVEDTPLRIEAKFGIALYPEHGNEPNILLQRATIALHTAKKENIDYSIYNLSHNEHGVRRLKLFGELRQALSNNELFLHYQPQIDIKTSQVKSVEALARWFHPTHGLIAPDDFIPMVEQSGLIKPFTHLVLEEAIRQIKHWSSLGFDIPICVNLSARNLLDPLLPDAIAKLLESQNVGPAYLTLEVTESAIMDRPERALKVLTSLHDMGLKLSIDDFGTGYSSLSYLKELPVSEMKIDQSFILGLPESQDNIIIVRSTIDLAHNMGMEIAAEGVEDEHVLAQLSALGCDIAQGYFISRPLSAQELESWLRESHWGLGEVTQHRILKIH